MGGLARLPATRALLTALALAALVVLLTLSTSSAQALEGPPPPASVPVAEPEPPHPPRDVCTTTAGNPVLEEDERELSEPPPLPNGEPSPPAPALCPPGQVLLQVGEPGRRRAIRTPVRMCARRFFGVRRVKARHSRSCARKRPLRRAERARQQRVGG